MSNTHTQPDTLAEIMARDGDLLPAVILSVTWPTVPVPPAMIFSPFPTHAYVRDGPHLVYVAQPAAPVTLSGADGTYWLAVHRDTHTAVSLWTRQPGTQYLWRASPTPPADVPGVLLLAQVTVAGGVITAVDVSRNNPRERLAFGGPTGALGFDPGLVWRGGRLGVNTANPSTVLDVNGGAHVSGSVEIGTELRVEGGSVLAGVVGIERNYDAAFSLATARGCYLGGATIIAGNLGVNTTGPNALFQLEVTGAAGKPGGGAWADTTSMAQYKADRQPIRHALAQLLALTGYTYTNTHPTHAGMGREMGFVAEEVQRVLPQWVLEPAPGTLTVGEQGATALLVEALREVVARLAALEAAGA